MTPSVKTVALVTENALVALDLTATIEDLFPWAEVVTLTSPPTPLQTAELAPGLLAMIIEQPQARTMDLDVVRRTGASVIVIGDEDARTEPGLAYLPMPFTTEMLTSVLTRVARPDPV
jgi:hypothetical protein